MMKTRKDNDMTDCSGANYVEKWKWTDMIVIWPSDLKSNEDWNSDANELNRRGYAPVWQLNKIDNWLKVMESTKGLMISKKGYAQYEFARSTTRSKCDEIS